MTTKSVMVAVVQQVPLIREGRITYKQAVNRIKCMCREYSNSTEYLVLMLIELVTNGRY